MKKIKYVLIAIALLLVLVGCTEKTEIQDENITTIEAVLQNALTGPSDELIKILNDLNGEEKFKALNQLGEKLYKDYFANNTAYMEFINSYGSVLMIEPMRNNYKLKVKNTDYEQTDSEEIIYNFSVDLQYQKEGSETSKDETVRGQANLNEEHKIEDMLVRMDDFLGSLDK